MSNGRGETGSVMGVKPERVRELLLEFHDGRVGKSFRPREATGFFMEREVTEEQANQLAQTYLRIYGVIQINHGIWIAENERAVRERISHRDWRMATGQLDLAGAEFLGALSLDAAPDSLKTLQERCREHVRYLRTHSDEER